VAQFGRSGEREVRVPGLEGALELGVSMAVRGQGERMFAHADSP